VTKGLLVLWLLVAATALLVLAADPKPPAERSPIVLEHANSLQVVEDQGQRRQELRGAVRITKDSLVVTCEHAVYYPDSGLLIFSDNVIFQDPNRILMADKVTYNELTEEVFAENRVRVYQHDTLSATAHTARYFNRLEQGWFNDDVQMRYENRRILLTGDRGFGDQSLEYGRVIGRPVLTERDSLAKILTRVRGDTIEYFGREKRARVSSHVKVERDSLTATGKLLDYFIADHRAVLLGSPEAIRGEDHVTGDTLTLVFSGDTLKQVEVGGGAVVTSPADSGFTEPKNRMEGKHMTLWIDSGLVKEVLVEGSAIARYHPREKTEKRGLNITSGDRLRVFFENRRMARIRVEGGTQGTYTPQRLLTNSQPDSSRH
jgi:lipopolysaccharide export system protein LptA